jgi:hypothetical protein
MSVGLRKTSTALILAVMLTWLFGGFALYPDAPIHRCAGQLDQTHKDGYCGKQGQPHTADQYAHFRVWESVLLWLWPVGMCALALLKMEQSREERARRHRDIKFPASMDGRSSRDRR